MRSGWIVAAALAAACGSRDEAWSGPPPGGPQLPVVRDVDGDRDGVLAGADCDDADPSAWATVWAHVDADRDGRGAGPLEQTCAGSSLRTGWSYEATDCDDGDITRWVAAPAYPDDDLDGAGEGAQQVVCTGGGALPTGFALEGGDCAPADGTRWRELGYQYRDADGDLRFAAAWGAWPPPTVCAGDTLPPGFADSAAGLDDDCDDADPAAWRTVYAWPDDDGDGAGEGTAAGLCVGSTLPPPWTGTGHDCAPGDATRWQWFSYAGLDGDGDGFGVVQAGELCAGAALPAPHVAAVAGPDCDDGDATRWQLRSGYVDGDGDAVGAGERLAVCAGAGLPSGLAPVTGDCAPLDPAAWTTLVYAYRDGDGDGRTIASRGALCAGAALPPGYADVGAGADCDDGDPSRWQSVVAYADADADGAGADAAVTLCTTGSVPAGYAGIAGDCSPADPARWRLVSYAGVDRDGDGVTAREPGQVCAGASLPDPFRPTLAGNDCDDAEPARYRWVVVYRDLDGDGVGAGPRTIPCLGLALPPAFSIFGFDADDASTTIQAVASDEDAVLLDL